MIGFSCVDHSLVWSFFWVKFRTGDDTNVVAEPDVGVAVDAP